MRLLSCTPLPIRSLEAFWCYITSDVEKMLGRINGERNKQTEDKLFMWHRLVIRKNKIC
jgi:hypothetical protein